MSGALSRALLLLALLANPAWAETEAYQDRLIEGLSPSEDDSETDYAYDSSGLPRYLRLETRLGTLPFDERSQAKSSMGFYGLIETSNHGSISLDGSVASGEGLGTVTYRQRAVPLSEARLGHLEAGVITPPMPNSLRRPLRVTVPVQPVRGISGEVESPASHGQWQVSTGQRGRLVSLPVTTFVGEPGRVSSLGGQWQLVADSDPLRSGTVFSVMHEDARGVTDDRFAIHVRPPFDVRSTLLGLSHDSGPYQLHARVLGTQGSNTQGKRLGVWVEGEVRQGTHTYDFGAYRLEPGLSWAGQFMANDLSGVFYRHQWRSREWLTDLSFDLLRSLEEPRRQGYYVNGSLRWRANRLHTLGAGLALRDLGTRAWSSYGDWRWGNPWGTTGLRVDLRGSSDRTQPGLYQLTYDQEWQVPLGWSLSTSLGAGRYGAVAIRNEPAEDFFQLALSMSAPLGNRGTFRGAAQTERDDSGDQRQSINLSADWRLGSGWSLQGYYTRYQGSTRLLAPLDPLAPPVVQTLGNSDRSFYVVLRYELQAGSRSVPLGGKPQEGGGRVEGVIFFDNNRNGSQEASENGVSGVTVFLDNRYAVSTDERGRFVFPFVAAGTRTISLRNDTLPLPWVALSDGETRVEIRLRDTTSLSIPVQRDQ
ncbi:MAG: SdrD B-like domain-containing protein [Pseudomonadota bacterium]|nr:hypothetical protein [Betaproteobacteria bacterium]